MSQTGQNIYEKTVTHAHRGMMFGGLISEVPTAFGMTFAQPFQGAQYEPADQTRKTHV